MLNEMLNKAKSSSIPKNSLSDESLLAHCDLRCSIGASYINQFSKINPMLLQTFLNICHNYLDPIFLIKKIKRIKDVLFINIFLV